MTTEAAATPQPVLRRLADLKKTSSAHLPVQRVARPAPPPAQRPDRPPTPPPDTRAIATWALRAVVETLGGRRPESQLTSLLGPQRRTIVDDLRRRLGRDHPVLRSVHAKQHIPGVIEAVALVRLGDRFRALAARLEQQPDSRWRCEVLALVDKS